jgi:hypothetical protein
MLPSNIIFISLQLKYTSSEFCALAKINSNTIPLCNDNEKLSDSLSYDIENEREGVMARVGAGRGVEGANNPRETGIERNAYFNNLLIGSASRYSRFVFN